MVVKIAFEYITDPEWESPVANKAELVDKVAEQAGVTKADAERTITALFDYIVAEVKMGNKASWPGFGTFSRSERAARKGRNPQTGDALQINASRSVKLAVSSTLKKDLTSGI